ncbi:preprotein translocase subunit YajC [Pseudoroseomonas ludipueritiae]|uniref:Preprotein translocase subunit YajC n=1 Tax=Pseudoroseomonas ludipueritiae TaxID=198093 RepID=A0ABR7R1R5_9PROT|nr:preprotein translocase subunit YajC [Pseudoroseomonas ludipueritiae]MBC9175685.1 preprotein translocase subunit YajC [Pseudoroseomonas ludipueritiae]
MRIRATLPLLALLGAFTVEPQRPMAQPAAVIGNDAVNAVVESVDLTSRDVLLRDETGALLSVKAPPELRNLPQLKPGDRVVLRVVSTFAAEIAQPGDPRPPSTTSAARAEQGEKPGGLLVHRERVRVRVEGVDVAGRSIAVIGPDRVPRRFTVRHQPMLNLLPSLKPGDELDVTFTDAVSLHVAPPAG